MGETVHIEIKTSLYMDDNEKSELPLLNDFDCRISLTVGWSEVGVGNFSLQLLCLPLG